MPTAKIRTDVPTPLQFADGYLTAARLFSFEGLIDGQEHIAFGLGDRAAAVTSTARRSAPLVRLHSGCLTGDVFGSQRCDCAAQLREAVKRIAASGGFVLYLRQEEGRAQMLRALRAPRIALLSNNPDKARQLQRFGVAGGRTGADSRAPFSANAR